MANNLKILFTEQNVVIPDVCLVMILLMKIYNKLEEAYRG